MKNKKILTGTLVGLAGLSAVAAPLVTMASCGQKNINLEKYDEIYGVDKFVYNTLELDFKNKINDAIQKDETLSQSEKEHAKTRTLKAAEIFRQQLTKLVGDANSKDVAYTTVTNSMIDYAENEWGVKLNRNTKATMSDIDKLYNGLYDSWKANMKNSGMSPTEINTILNGAQKSFTEMKTSLTSKYNDALAALIKAKRFMAVVFADVNKEIGLMAASIRLQDFMTNYTFEYNESRTDNKINQLEGSARQGIVFAEKSDITPWMNDLFTIRNSHTGEIVQTGFTNDLIPGYKITPVLDKINHDTKKNKHSISIDWQCVKTTYASGGDAAKTTAHLFAPNSDNLFKGLADGHTVNDVFNSDDETTKPYLTMSYDVSKTSDGILTDLLTEYPLSNPTTQANDSLGLKFKWDIRIDEKTGKEDRSHCAYEPFLRGAKYAHSSTADYDKYFVSQNDLADTGLMFSTDDGQTWTRLDALTRSENNRRALEENELSSNLSLESRQFVDGCTINADVLLEKSASLNSPNDAHFAKVTLRYSYENAPDQVVEVPIDSAETSGFPISRDAFVQIENQYNKARLYYESFENNTFQQDLDAMHSQKVMQDVVMGLTATFDSIFIATSLMPTTNPKQKACNIAYVITSAIDLALQIASYSVFRVYKWNVVKDYAEKAEDFKKSQTHMDMRHILQQDKNDFGLIDSANDGATDGGIYDDMYENGDPEKHIGPWKEMDGRDFLRLQNHYSSQHEAAFIHTYKKAADDAGLNIDEYHNKLNGWDEGGKWDMMTTAFTHGSLTILGIQMILGFFDPALTAATVTRAQAEAGVRTAQYASKNLYTRMVDMFKSLYVGAKDFFITIKTKIQEGRLLRLLESKPEKALEYIKEHVSLFVRGTREATGNYRPLFNVKFAKGGIRGQFANGTDFLNALAKEFKAMPTDEVFRSVSSSSLANMAARKKMEAFYKELLKTDVYGHWMKNFDQLYSYDDMIRQMANAIDNDIRSYRGILDPSLAPKDGFPEEIVKKAIENANNLLNRTWFDEGNSIYSALLKSLNGLVVDTNNLAKPGWAIYFFRQVKV